MRSADNVNPVDTVLGNIQLAQAALERQDLGVGRTLLSEIEQQVKALRTSNSIGPDDLNFSEASAFESDESGAADRFDPDDDN